MRTIRLLAPALAIGLVTGLALPAKAEDAFRTPRSCKLIVTSQFSDCSVDNRYRCGDADQTYYRIETFEADGAKSVSREDASNAPVSLIDSEGDGMVFPSASGTPMKTVLETGKGSQYMQGEAHISGDSLPMSAKVRLRATGKTVELAGKIFHKIAGDITIKMPKPLGTTKGAVVYGYLPAEDILVELEYTFDTSSGDRTFLKTVSLKGMAGFGAKRPRYGCTAKTSALANPLQELPA